MAHRPPLMAGARAVLGFIQYSQYPGKVRRTVLADHQKTIGKAGVSRAGRQRPMIASELEGVVEVFRFGDFAGLVYEAR